MTRGATRRGFAREIKVARSLREQGWLAWTTKNDGQEHDDKRHSHGIVDVVALKRIDGLVVPRLIQVKSTARPYERFGPAEREELLGEGRTIRARAEWLDLWHWPAHARTPTVIPSSSWP